MVRVGQWVCFNDEHGADHDALVTAVHAGMSGPDTPAGVDLVIVDTTSLVVQLHRSVPHYQGRLVTTIEQRKHTRRRGEPIVTEQPITRRQPGAYWRD